MPDTTITIDRDQRDGLYELVRNHLGSIEDFWIALERTRDFAKAEQLALEFAEDFRLLRDIGWSDEEEREVFELTMSAPDLSDLFQRLRDEAAGLLVERGLEARSKREDMATEQRLRAGSEACERLLADLDPLNGKPRPA